MVKRYHSLVAVAFGGAVSSLTFGGAFAADLPAVSGVNGKIAAAFDAMNDKETGTLTGSFVTPLGHAFGLQLDGAVGSNDGDGDFGVGAHAFWRDPEKALLGIYASYSGIDGDRDVNVGTVAGEGEVYFGPVSLEGLAGVDYGYGETNFFGSATLILPGRQPASLRRLSSRSRCQFRDLGGGMAARFRGCSECLLVCGRSCR
ncbi:hypothetical protein [Breoghania sp.]|uniref:hypothetical protein n=1 Tax=Breoghania sp. TaxID=2065378 RepID=UPI00261F7BAC|nr:hypothetical protein [Breoghania sp.]MDJ0932579.1 hypothetical protein [Breoghania sp.]